MPGWPNGATFSHVWSFGRLVPLLDTPSDVGLRAHHAANDFSLFNVKNTAQTLSEYRFKDCDHVTIGCVRRHSFTVFEPALHGPQDRDCAPVPSGAPEETQVGWIQSKLYPSSTVIGQQNVSDTSRCQ